MPAPQIDDLPPAPVRGDRLNFPTVGDAFVAALPDFVDQTNAVGTFVEARANESEAAAQTSAESAATAAASASEAESLVGAGMWDAAANYATGAAAISPTDYQTYRRESPGGVNATDPAASSAWTPVAGGRVLRSGDTMSGPLSVPAGASGTQVPRAQETVLRTQILGTVSQAVGVPTGAVVETGSNANGRYTRWADGTQICTHTVSAGGTTAQGSGTYAAPWQTAPLDWTFPIAFSSAPNINAAGTSNGTAARNRALLVSWEAISATAVTVVVLHKITSDPVSNTASAHLLAVGRWF